MIGSCFTRIGIENYKWFLLRSVVLARAKPGTFGNPEGREWAGSGRSAFSAQGLESCKSADDPLWPSALACFSAKSRRRTGAQTGPGCAFGDPDEDGDCDYCEGSDDHDSSGPNAVFCGFAAHKQLDLEDNCERCRSAMINSEKRDSVLRR